MPKTSRPTRSASSISSNKWCMRSTGLSVRPVAGSEMAAAKLSIPICILFPFLQGNSSRPSFDSGPEPLGALTDLFQYCFKTSHFFRTHIGKHFSNFGSVLPKNRPNQFFASRCKRYHADAPVFATLDPAYQPSIQQPVDGHADRSRRKVHLRPDRIHRPRSFVQKRFQYAEVGIVNSRLLKSRIEIFGSRLVRLNPYQPAVHRAREVLSRVLGHDQYLMLLCDQCLQGCIHINRLDINR